MQVCVEQHFHLVLHIHTHKANKTMELSEREEPRQRHGKVNEAFASEVSQTFDFRQVCLVLGGLPDHTEYRFFL